MFDEWSKIRIKCRRMGPENVRDPPEDPIHTFTSARETEREAKRILRETFPDGPAAAKAARDAYQEWEKENVMRFFNTKTPKSPEAQRWENFESAWRQHAIEQQSRGIMTAAFDARDFSFSGRGRGR